MYFRVLYGVLSNYPTDQDEYQSVGYITQNLPESDKYLKKKHIIHVLI